jgi:hypothetical protein
MADEYDRRADAAAERVAKLLKEEGAQAQALFDRITKRYGLLTAKLIFERCIKLAKEPSIEEEQEQRVAAKARAKATQKARAMSNLPTADEIAAAVAAGDRRRICIWWYRWPVRELNDAETKIYFLLWRSLVTVGGYPKDFNPEQLPPAKKTGSKMRNSPNAELPRLFEQEKAKHGGKLTKAAFAVMYADRFGPTPEDVRKKLDYYERRKT